MNNDNEISKHYSRGNLLERLTAMLTEDGVDPDRPSMDALSPYDQFHGRGLEATEEIASMIQVGTGDHILNVGSGIGGPARYFANRFGCRVTGIDLTPEFCEVARHLTRLLGFEARINFETGDALAMPFADAIESAETEYRHAAQQVGKNAELREVELSDEVSQRCKSLAAGLGLVSGGCFRVAVPSERPQWSGITNVR